MITPRTGPSGAGNAMGGGRLTLESGVGVSTTDQLAKTSVFYTPHRSALIALFYSSVWSSLTFAELTLSVPASTSQMYDVFAFTTDGLAVQLEALAWTNDTTRATPLVKQNGIWVKTGATDRRYLGSFRTTTVSGQTEDSSAKRFVWNADNRAARQLKLALGAGTYTYLSATKRQWNGSTANQVAYIVGLVEDVIPLVFCQFASSTAGNFVAGIGVNSTTAFSGMGAVGVTSPNGVALAGVLNQLPSLGYSFAAGVEASDGVNTATFNATATTVAGILGNISA